MSIHPARKSLLDASYACFHSELVDVWEEVGALNVDFSRIARNAVTSPVVLVMPKLGTNSYNLSGMR